MNDQNNQNQTDHEWFIERLAEFFAGGLNETERERFESHRAACETCRAEFDAMAETEKTMTQLFSSVSPAANFEDRLIAGLRDRAPRLRINPVVRRAAIAAAAAIVLGGFGFVANQQIEREAMGPTTQESRLNAANNVAEGFTLPESDATKAQWYMGGAVRQTGVYALAGRRIVLKDQTVTESRSSIDKQLGDFTAGRDLKTGESNLQPQLNAAGAINRESSRRLYDEVGAARQVPVQLGTTANLGEAANDSLRHRVDGHDLYYKPDEAGKAPTPGAVLQQRLAGGGGGGGFGGNSNGNFQNGSSLEAKAEARKTVVGFEVADLGDATKNKTGGTVVTDIPAAPVAVAPNAPDQPPPPTTQPIGRKIVRNGEIEFEVDSFDSVATNIAKIVAEEQGYIATTNSDKLPNGKVKGAIVVRVPPDHLDTLVMKLRALGDLKRQNLTAQDVTKQYTDTAGELKAARAMEDRLLDIIKKSTGQIKDLLAAEKELATWREKIEKLEGEIRYYDNLVSLSTLNISLYERDIKTPAAAKETENVDMGVEADDVEAARSSAIKAIEDAKGRVLESEMKQLDAGQFAAKIVADISPDTAGPALDRLKQLGKTARLEVHRQQTTADGQPPVPGTKLERGDTHLVISLYNLANVAPRQTSNLNLAAENVEQVYHAILDRVAKVGGRIVASNLNRQTDQQTSGTIQFEVKSADADAALADIRKIGEVTRLTAAENPDTNNVTAAKRGFAIQIMSLASLTPRETHNRKLACADADKSYLDLLAAARSVNARINVSRTEDFGGGQRNGYLDIEVTRPQLDAIEKAIAAAGEIVDRSVATQPDAENVTDSKTQFKLAIIPAFALPPRQVDSLGIEVADVDGAAQKMMSAAQSAGGRIVDSNFTKDSSGQTARVIIEIPLTAADQIVAEAKQQGTVRGSQQSTNQQAPSGEVARARIELTLASGDLLVMPDHGVMSSLRHGFSTSFAGLMWSLQLIVIGLCFVVPWVAVIWGGMKLLKRRRRKVTGT